MPDIKPSFLIQLRNEIVDAVVFEPWDNLTKKKIDDLMQLHNLDYEVTFDERNTLNITVLDKFSKYSIVI